MQNKKKARVIAFYLPQFHPIPENDKWWGRGFTEWTNVGNAKPLFKGHYQPRVPADLGYYDLRMPEVRKAQAELARDAGIEGFCYWHYWFGNGKQLLERPFNEVLASGEPDFPFCLGWANHSWSTKTWVKSNGSYQNQTIVEQLYPGEKDNVAHFRYVLKAFKDKRYIRVDGKPVFVIFDPFQLPDCISFIHLWQKLARENGLEGIHFVGYTQNTSGRGLTTAQGQKAADFYPVDKSDEYYRGVLNLGFDAVASIGLWRAEAVLKGRYRFLLHRLLNNKVGFSYVRKFDYREVMENYYVPEDAWENVYPSLVPQWDRSPRAGGLNGVYIDSTPERFKEAIEKALKLVENKPDEHKILFLKSWNEWAEGNYVEPDLKYGHGYLDAIRSSILR